MNKIFKHRYAAAKLPDDPRNGLGVARDATVTIEIENEIRKHVMSVDEIFLGRGAAFRMKDEIDEERRRDRKIG